MSHVLTKVLSLVAVTAPGPGNSMPESDATNFTVILIGTGATPNAVVGFETQLLDGTWPTIATFSLAGGGLTAPSLNQAVKGPLGPTRLNVYNMGGLSAITGEIIST